MTKETGDAHNTATSGPKHEGRGGGSDQYPRSERPAPRVRAERPDGREPDRASEHHARPRPPDWDRDRVIREQLHERFEFISGLLERVLKAPESPLAALLSKLEPDGTDMSPEDWMRAFKAWAATHEQKEPEIFCDGTLAFVKVMGTIRPDMAGTGIVCAFDVQTLLEVNAILDAGVQAITQDMHRRMRGQ
jgi:hypothetical protein